jgi:DNA polymerase I-like protein with 3'-5' exonuclease and polymerase domains
VATDWRPPTELPDLRRGDAVALDTETKDEGLLTNRGSGWPFRAGYICGVSIAFREDGGIRALYVPIRHPDTANFERDQVFRWLKDLIASDVRIITQNGIYDWGWLRSEADIVMPPSERLEEIGALATIIDENRFSYGLDSLCSWRGLPGKEESLLREGAAACGLPKKAKLQANIWQLPARYVGPYAEIDAVRTLELFDSLNPILDHEGTRAAYRLEVDLLPMVHEMRRRGIRVDTAAAEQARDLLLQRRDATFAELSDKLGTRVGMEEIGRTKWLAETFDAQKIAYPRTEKGNPSFTAGTSGWMLRHPHWLPQLIVKADKYNHAAVHFIENHILGHVVNGRVHAEIHPHRSDEGGTRSLRFSYSNPPLQQMPSRDEELAPLIRGVFLPEEGEVWAKPDISQQEFRLVVHYAVRHKLHKANEAAERYRNDPTTDFHKLVATWTSLDRTSAKNTNFAKIYGAGVRKFAQMIGKPEREAREIYAKYDRELPFVGQLSKLCQGIAARQGYIELYDGARRHFELWEAPGVAWTKGAGPCSREEAERRLKDPSHPWYGHSWIRRAETHKAMNALIQGSAARHTKLWMRACWRDGIVPLLQMHDALDCSVSSPEQAELVAQLGRDAVSLVLPMQVGLKFGRNWGDAKHTWSDLHEAVPGDTRQKPGASVAPEPSIAKLEAPAIPPPPPRPTAKVEAPAAPPTNGTRVYVATAEAPIELPIPHLADLVDQPLVSGKVLCPFHDDRTPSCHIYTDHFHCFGCGAHGDAIDWLIMIKGLDRDAAIELLANWRGPISQPHRSEDEADTLASALRLWEQAQTIAGTLAAHYLADVRKIDTDKLPANIENVLRFHPCCMFRPGTQVPCLLALFRDVPTDVPAGIHRIALTPEVLAGGKVERRMLGRWPAARAIKLWPTESSLVIGEGIETVLAAATRITHRDAPLRPAWAIGSSSGIARFPLIAAIERLTILVDNDASGVGPSSAKECAKRWAAAGRTVALLTPQQSGADFNDLVPGSARHEVHPH